MRTLISMVQYIRRNLVIWFIGMLVPALFSLATNVYFANRLEAYTAYLMGDNPLFWHVAVMMAFSIPVLLLLSGIDDVGRYIFSFLVASVDNTIKQDFYIGMTRASLKDLQRFSKGELITRYCTDAEQSTSIIVMDINGVIYPLIVGIGYLTAVLYENIWIGIIMVTLGVGVIVLNFLFYKRIIHLQKEILRSCEGYTRNCNDAIHGKMSIRQYAAKGIMAGKIERSAKMIYQKELQQTSLQVLKVLTSDALANICTYLLTPLACIFAVYGYIGIPVVLFIHQICRNFITYTQNFANSFIQLNTHALSYERLRSIMVLPAEYMQIDNCTDVLLPNESIIFENVNVSYGEHRVLKNVNLFIQPGEIVCLVGESGSGKTTLVKALLQMVDYQGRILIGGVDCKDIPLSVLRGHIGLSPEHNDLFPMSVYDNIKFGDLYASELEIDSVMEKAAIKDLNEMKERQAGESGSFLSGGQRQKVSFARVLLKNSPVIILDEPTAALDNESELQILSTIENLKKEGKSVLMITHKLSSLPIADRIFRIEDGEILEQKMDVAYH